MLSSMGAEALHTWAFPHLGEKTSETVSMAVSAGANGAVLAALLNAVNPQALGAFGLATIIGTGAVAEIVGSSLYERAIKTSLLS